MTYGGSGYAVDPTTGEAIPAHAVQDYLANRWTNTQSFLSINFRLASFLNSLSFPQTPPFDLPTFYQQYGETNPFPPTIDGFIDAFLTYFQIPPQPFHIASLKLRIRTSVKESMSIENINFDKAQIIAALNDPSLQANSATFFTDLYDAAFARFLREFDFTGATSQDGSLPTTVGGTNYANVPYFDGRFKDFFFTFATVVNPTDSSVNFQEIYDGFFGANPTQFTSFLANYIQNALYATPNGSFVPNEEIGPWLKKVQESYSLALYGSAVPTNSSVGESTERVIILDQILRLIIRIIGTLQKVAAMQSDRLRVLTLQQSAYTNLLTQVPVFTQGDGTIFGRPTTGTGALTSKDEAQKARDQANTFNQTLSETIRSKRTTVQDDAKLMQNNVQQSNESANDQASTATALLQTMSSLLAAIMRG